MPKLDEEVAKQVDDAESSGGLMQEGIYETVLHEVKTGDGDKGPYWTWVFKNPETNLDGSAHPYKNWNHWHNTSLSEASAWKLKEVFEAFGVPSDTDTDELIGRRVRVVVGTRTIQKGKREGEPTNTVENVLPIDDDESPNPNGKKAEKALF